MSDFSRRISRSGLRFALAEHALLQRIEPIFERVHFRAVVVDHADR